MAFSFETDIQEPGSETFHLEVVTVRRWVPVAAYRYGVEVHGLRKLKYVFGYGLGGMLLLFLVSLPFLIIGLIMAFIGLLMALAALASGWRQYRD
jgi:hypothetical protein